MNALDPMPVENMGNPEEWFKNIQGTPELGTLFIQAPEKAAEVLAAQGVPPPPPVRTAQAGPVGQAGAVTPGGAVNGAAPTPQGVINSRFPRANEEMKQGQQITQYPHGPEQTPMTVKDAEPSGSALDPQTNPDTSSAVPQQVDSKVPGGMTGKEPSGLSKIVQGLNAIKPPTISPVGNPAPPVPRADATPNVHFAPQGPAPHRGEVSNPLQLLQAMKSPGALAMLSQLLRRG